LARLASCFVSSQSEPSHLRTSLETPRRAAELLDGLRARRARQTENVCIFSKVTWVERSDTGRAPLQCERFADAGPLLSRAAQTARAVFDSCSLICRDRAACRFWVLPLRAPARRNSHGDAYDRSEGWIAWVPFLRLPIEGRPKPLSGFGWGYARSIK
jgi:hypothetical protein